MPPINPDHLFEQADDLAAKSTARQADLRRAISAAYYGIFHFALTAAADMIHVIGNDGVSSSILLCGTTHTARDHRMTEIQARYWEQKEKRRILLETLAKNTRDSS